MVPPRARAVAPRVDANSRVLLVVLHARRGDLDVLRHELALQQDGARELLLLVAVLLAKPLDEPELVVELLAAEPRLPV